MKIICIGRNYVDHAKELNNPLPSEPLFFMKPDSALLLNNNPFFYPDFSSDIHYECELVYRINKVGRNISEKFAHKYYNEVALGVDFTARDLQEKCKKNGAPWELAKAFDQSAVLSKFIHIDQLKNQNAIGFSLLKNEVKVQQGESNEMIFNIDQIIAYISQFITLKIGDLIFTGTPAGVGSIAIGDRLQGYLEDQMMYDFKIK